MKFLALHAIGEFVGGISAGVLSDFYGHYNVLYWLQILVVATFIQANVIEGIQMADNRASADLNYSFQFFSGLIESAYFCLSYSIAAMKFKKVLGLVR